MLISEEFPHHFLFEGLRLAGWGGRSGEPEGTCGADNGRLYFCFGGNVFRFDLRRNLERWLERLVFCIGWRWDSWGFGRGNRGSEGFKFDVSFFDLSGEILVTWSQYRSVLKEPSCSTNLKNINPGMA